MPLPLLALLGIGSGIATGGFGLMDMLRQRRQESDAARTRLDVGTLLGAPAQPNAPWAGGLMAGDTGPPTRGAYDAAGEMSRGSGLLADPSLTEADRARLTFAGGLMGMPGNRDQGEQILGQILGGIGSEQGAMERQRLAGSQAIDRQVSEWNHQGNVNAVELTRFKADEAGRELKFLQDSEKFGPEYARELMEKDRAASYGSEYHYRYMKDAQARADAKAKADADRFSAERVAAAKGADSPFKYGGAPEGAAIVPGPGGIPVVMHYPGSKVYIEHQKGLDQGALAMGRVTRMVGMMNQAGTSMLGAPSGSMSFLYGRIIEDLGKMGDLGVLQVGDVERLQSQLINPTTAMAKTRGMDYIRAQYQEALQTMQAQYEAYKARMTPAGVMGTVRPPDTSKVGSGGKKAQPTAPPKGFIIQGGR